jgi:succinate dehydrogenase/fumarate reductase iron-sulfur protein
LETTQERMALKVARWRPGHVPVPYFDEYEVPYREDMVVLDALNHIKDHVDGSLAYRWSCRMGVCGSCGMMVNGEPRLTCATFLREFHPEPVVVEPLQYFPVVRDLVVDMSDFMEKLKEVKPWIIRQQEKPVEEGEYLQTPEEIELYKQFSMCINCMLCYSACPVYGQDHEFLGPAVIALAHRYNLDSRDEGRAERKEVLEVDWGIWDCTFVGECTVVCPKDVDPAAAIQRSKVAAATDTLRSVVWPFAGPKVRTGAGRRYDVHVPKVPRTWWLKAAPYRRFVARELTSVFVGAWSVILLLFLFALFRGREAYEAFLRWLALPAIIALSVVVLGAVLYHMGTWLRLTAHVTVVRILGKAVPGPIKLAALVLALIVASAAVAYFHVWF